MTDKTLRFSLKPYHYNVTKEELINDLRLVSSRLGKSAITYREYQEYGKYSATTLKRRFQTFNNALLAAGLTLTHTKTPSVTSLFDNLQAVWIAIGRQPAERDLQKPVSRFSSRPYKTQFGSWRLALEAFVNFAEDESLSRPSSTQQSTNRRSAREPNPRLKFLVMRRDNFKCQYCGKSPATHVKVQLHIDHIVPWSNGGETTLDNLRTLCSDCNLGKSNLTHHS